MMYGLQRDDVLVVHGRSPMDGTREAEPVPINIGSLGASGCGLLIGFGVVLGILVQAGPRRERGVKSLAQAGVFTQAKQYL